MITDAEIDAKSVSEMNPMEAIFILAERLGVTKIVERFPGACWEHQVDERWWIAVNPHRITVTCSHGTDVDPSCVLVEFNGWPAGVFNIAGRGVFAKGTAANEDSFNTACLAAAKAVGR